MFGITVLLTGCSANSNINTNPDEENFDANYQGSSELDLENAGMNKEGKDPAMGEEVDSDGEMTEATEAGVDDIEEESEMLSAEETENTGTGETSMEVDLEAQN